MFFFLKIATVTLTLSLGPKSLTCLRYCHTQHLCEVILKSINKCRFWSDDKVFRKISSDLDLEPRTLKVKHAEILSYPTFVCFWRKNVHNTG